MPARASLGERCCHDVTSRLEPPNGTCETSGPCTGRIPVAACNRMAIRIAHLE